MFIYFKGLFVYLSHFFLQIADYFRTIIEETIGDISNNGCLEAKITLLQLEIEQMKYNHAKEIADLKHNTGKDR